MAMARSAPVSRYAFLAGLLVAAIALAWQASKVWLADYRLESGRLSEMEKSAALLPGNADAWDRLGRLYLFSFSDPNVPLATSYFQKAVAIDPLSEHYWLDLAEAYQEEKNSGAALDALDHARQVYPSSAVVAWVYGNFLLAQGKPAEGYEEMRQAIHSDRTLLIPAISSVWHSSGDVNELLDHVVPADAESYFAALDFFSSIHDGLSGLAVWKRIADLKAPIRLEACFPFLDELIHENDAANARVVWNEATELSEQPNLATGGNSIISDESFEADFPNGGLGWRWKPEVSATINFDVAPPAGRGRSIRVDFNGGVNLNLSQPAQFVAVEPATAYRFHALMRTDQITTDSGLRFSLVDPAHSDAPTLVTENLTGSNPWKAVDGELLTGPATHFLNVRLFREPSRLFENKLSGSVWIGDISLVPLTDSAGHPKP